MNTESGIVNSDSGKAGKSVHVRSEWVFTLSRNRCSRSAGMAVHDGPEYAIDKLVGVVMGSKSAEEVAAQMNAYSNEKRLEKGLDPLTADKEKSEEDVKKMVRESLREILDETTKWRNLAETLVDELNELMSTDEDLDKRDLKLVVRCANRLKDALDKTAQVV